MKAKTFDRKFDAGEQIIEQLELGKARRAGTDAKRVNVDFPAWMVGVPQVGGALHTEYWIPAADLHTFNENIVGEIQVIREFH